MTKEKMIKKIIKMLEEADLQKLRKICLFIEAFLN